MEWKPITELRSVTCRMGSHSVNCHPTQVNAPALTPAMQAGTSRVATGGGALPPPPVATGAPLMKILLDCCIMHSLKH